MRSSQEPRADDRVRSSVDRVLSHLVDTALLACTVAAIPALIASASRVVDIGWQPVIGVQLAVYAALVFLAVRRRRLSYAVRVAGLLVCAFVVGISGMLSLGLLSVGAAAFFVVMVFAVFTYGKTGAILAAAASGFAMTAIGISVVLGFVGFDFDFFGYAHAPMAWFNAVTSVLLYLAVVGSTLVRLRGHFTESARELDRRARELAERNLALNKEIAERRRTERELEEYRSHLEELVRERTAQLEQAHQELIAKERMATLGRLTATVSHELRNPLGVMRLSLDSLQATPRGNGNFARAFERASRSISRCEAIVSELMDYARGPGERRERAAIDDWLMQTLGELDLPPNLELSTDLRSRAVLPINPDSMRRGVLNLVTNAIEAMASATTSGEGARPMHLAVESCTEDARVLIRFKDEGPGMEPEVLARAGEPLFSTKSFGFGLGLAIVRQTLERHGGGMQLDSKLGEGTTVTLWLPLEQGRSRCEC